MTSTLRLSSSTDTKSSEQVTAADQSKINRFARLNNNLEDVKTHLKKLKSDVENLGDAGDELMMADDVDSVPLKIGDTFIEYSPDALQEKLDAIKEEAEAERMLLETKAAGLKEEMQSLKVDLYAKFGTAINLEHDETE